MFSAILKDWFVVLCGFRHNLLDFNDITNSFLPYGRIELKIKTVMAASVFENVGQVALQYFFTEKFLTQPKATTYVKAFVMIVLGCR